MSATATQSGPFRNSGAFRSHSILSHSNPTNSQPFNSRRNSGSFAQSANFKVEEKAKLRKEVIARRNAISPLARAEKSAQICEQLKLYVENWAEERQRDNLIVALYHCMRSEVDVSLFTRWIFSQNYYAAFPCMMMGPRAAVEPMQFLEVPASICRSGGTPFMRNPLKSFHPDSPELAPYPVCEPYQLDVIVVPMVAFDDSNNRLGYGGGNYDAYLPRMRSDALVLGVAFEEQRVLQVPKHPYDIPLPFIVTA